MNRLSEVVLLLPGTAPGAHKRNVVVLLVYILLFTALVATSRTERISHLT
jgi:hypothetical protein